MERFLRYSGIPTLNESVAYQDTFNPILHESDQQSLKEKNCKGCGVPLSPKNCYLSRADGRYYLNSKCKKCYADKKRKNGSTTR